MPKDKELDEILTAVEGHGKYHTSAYDGPVMMVSEAKAAILKKYISRAEVLEMLKDENFDNNYPSVTDIEVIRNQLKAELRQKLGADHE